MADQTEQLAPFDTALLHPRYWGRWCAIAVLSVLCLLPWRVLDGVGYVAGVLCYRYYEKHRRYAQRNIGWCFPDLSTSEKDALLRAHFIAYWQTLLLTPVLWWGNRARFVRRVDFVGEEKLRDALATGPVIVLSCHSIALDFGAAAVAACYSAVSMYKPFKHPIDNWLVFRGRQRFNNVLVKRGSSMRTLIKKVREGTPCYHMPDEDLGREGALFAPFFGREKATVLGMSKLTRATRAKVVPCYPYYAGNGRFAVHFLEPLDGFPCGDELASSTRINAAIESLIRIRPAHYLWKLPLFRTRAGGGANPYQRQG